MSNTIIYLTDHSVPEPIYSKCQQMLKEAAGDIPIISVSHRPMDFGTKNINYGKRVRRCWLSLYNQLWDGLKAAETENIAIAEHDCIYTHEHLSFTPPRPDTMYYNQNHWLVQWNCDRMPELQGMYSYWPRRTPMSMLVGNREFLLKDTELRVRLLVDPNDDVSVIRAQMWAGRERGVSLQYLLANKLPDHPFDRFSTKIPSLDIRHSRNFTGPKRGKKRCFEIPYWGKFKDVMEAQC